jgi:hypothetical protein
MYGSRQLRFLYGNKGEAPGGNSGGFLYMSGGNPWEGSEAWRLSQGEFPGGSRYLPGAGWTEGEGAGVSNNVVWRYDMAIVAIVISLPMLMFVRG